MAAKNPILVTGSHRSGTTWVGRTLAVYPPVVYFHEPFNLDHPLDGLSVPAQYWFTYVCQDNDETFYPALKRMLDWRVNPYDPERNSPTAGAGARLRDYLRPIKYRWKGARALIKDPIALFSAPWLAIRFEMQVVVMIRHPAAFVSSIKLLNWKFPFSHFLSQPLLMRDYLQTFEAEITEYAEVEHSVIDQATLLWNLIHDVIRKYTAQHPDWIFVRHEDLSRDPLNGFRAMYTRLDLEFSPRVADFISAHSLAQNTTDQSRTDPYALHRHSPSNMNQWKTRLSPAEIEKIRLSVGEIAKSFYSDEEW